MQQQRTKAVAEADVSAASELLQHRLDSSLEGLRQSAASFDWGIALEQGETAVQTSISNAFAPFDAFHGNWPLNILLFAVVGVTSYALVTGPKQ